MLFPMMQTTLSIAASIPCLLGIIQLHVDVLGEAGHASQLLDISLAVPVHAVKIWRLGALACKFLATVSEEYELSTVS